MPFLLSRSRLLVCLLFVIAFLPEGTTAIAQVDGSSPNLSNASVAGRPLTLVVVEGEGFTPDGLVYVVVYDRWGEDVYGHVWATAAHGNFGVSGSQDPNLGYIAAGTLDIVIDLSPAVTYSPNGFQIPTTGVGLGAGQAIAAGACGRDLMVRAYDQQSAAWSNLLDVTAQC
jgi:hypothetical protein